MICKIIFLLSLSQAISCSLVVDSTAQRSVYVTDYCPKMKFCPEGAHIMCMYYNAKSKMGPRCTNVQNISMTPELANKLVDVSNAIRSRIAQGKEKGKNGESLPRGYGIFRLNWDSELATFAQVLANQCVLRHDLCRATNRFPDPGQTAGLVRFSYPDWFPVSKSGNFATPGLDPAKLMYATTQILKSWYGQKNAVTSNMITYYPDWTLNPNNQNGRLYLEMIYGSATHMGCGISAYTEYAFYDNNAALNYNSVQIICNYSARPRKSTAVYNTVPPGDTAIPFSQCGCPAGSEGDEECLCKEVTKDHREPPTQLKHTPDCPAGEVCDPTVVVLPIFTVEDAPPEKLFNHESFSNTSLKKSVYTTFASNENDLFNIKRNHQLDEIVNKPQAKSEYKTNVVRKQSRVNIRKQNNTKSYHPGVVIRNRYFDKNHMELKQERGQSRYKGNLASKKTSIFNRVAKFKLPETRIYSPNKGERKIPEIKDVVPRKEFTNSKELAQYFNGKNDIQRPLHNDIINGEINAKNELPKTETKLQIKLTSAQEKFRIDKKHHLHEVFNILKATKPFQANQEIIKYHKIPTTETVLHTAEQKLITDDTFFKGIVSNANDYNSPFNSVTEETDNKLMALLDTLEQEVKHVELRDKDKQLFDAKIRKIYGKVVGTPVNLLDFYIKPDTKSNETRRTVDTQDYNVIQKSIQQDPNEESIYKNHKMKKERLDDLDVISESRIRMNDKFKNNSKASDRSEPEKIIEKHLYKKRYNLRGMKHSAMSHEQMREKYDDYETEHDFGERKSVRNNDFDRNTLIDIDESRQRPTDRYRSKINERDRYIDDEVEYRGRRIDHYLKNDDNERIINKNYYLSNGAGNDDPLSAERRRFYQEKLNNIERRLQIRNHKRRKNNPRHMRPMRPATRKLETQMDIYGRARFAHGY